MAFFLNAPAINAGTVPSLSKVVIPLCTLLLQLLASLPQASALGFMKNVEGQASGAQAPVTEEPDCTMFEGWLLVLFICAIVMLICTFVACCKFCKAPADETVFGMLGLFLLGVALGLLALWVKIGDGANEVFLILIVLCIICCFLPLLYSCVLCCDKLRERDAILPFYTPLHPTIGQDDSLTPPTWLPVAKAGGLPGSR